MSSPGLAQSTPIQSPGEVRCRNGRIWTYLGDTYHPYLVYDYTPDRTRAGPTAPAHGLSLDEVFYLPGNADPHSPAAPEEPGEDD